MIPWGPLGAGFLSGRYKRGERPPAGSRIADASDDLEEAYDRRAVERNFRVVDAAGAIAEQRGATVAQVALAWLIGTDGITAPIVGPRTFEQLEDVLGADGLELTADERARLEAPAPGFAILNTCGMGPQVMAMITFYLYGEQGAAAAARDEEWWQAWMKQQFPTEA